MLNEYKLKEFLNLAIELQGSQKLLADKIGVSQESISRWLRKERNASWENLVKVGEVIGWDEERIKSFLIDNYGNPESIFKSPERLNEILRIQDLATLARIVKQSSALLNQKIEASTLILSRVGTREEVKSPYVSVGDSTVINLTHSQRLKLSLVLEASLTAQRIKGSELAEAANLSIGTVNDFLEPYKGEGESVPEELLESLRPYIYQFKMNTGKVEIIKNQPYPSIHELVKALNSENGVLR